MGIAKDALMEHQEADEIAKGLLVETGYLKYCEYHLEVYGDTWDDEALKLAYKIANARISNGEISLPFGFSRRDFTDLIKEQAHAQPEECWGCAKWLEGFHVSEAHLHRYLAEFDFRYNQRARLGVDDNQRMEKAAKGIAGKRLTYRRARGAEKAEDEIPF